MAFFGLQALEATLRLRVISTSVHYIHTQKKPVCVYRWSFFNQEGTFSSVHLKEYFTRLKFKSTSLCNVGNVFQMASLWLTYICGLLLRQFQFLLSILQGLRVLVQLILRSLQLLLQSEQLILQLKEAERDRESWRVQKTKPSFRSLEARINETLDEKIQHCFNTMTLYL